MEVRERRVKRGLVLDDRVNLGFVVRYGGEKREKNVCFKASRKGSKGTKEHMKKMGLDRFGFVCLWTEIRRLAFGIPGPLTFIVEGLAVGAEGVDSIYCLQERENEERKKKRSEE